MQDTFFGQYRNSIGIFPPPSIKFYALASLKIAAIRADKRLFSNFSIPTFFRILKIIISFYPIAIVGVFISQQIF